MLKGARRRLTEPGRREDQTARRVIDLAIGILIGLRECSEQEASDDLVAAGHDTGYQSGCSGPSLMGQAGGSEAPLPTPAARSSTGGVTYWHTG